MNGTATSGQSKEEVALRALNEDVRLETLREMLTEFNLFDVLGVERSELQHSRVLEWLLDPHGSHGLGNSFLRGFLTCISFDGDRTGVFPAVVAGWDLLDVETARERHRIDILVVGESDGFVCLIENKVDSGEHTGQLSRYLKVVKRRYSNLTTVLPVFLTPVGARPSKDRDAERYVSLGYSEIADLLSDVLETRGAAVNSNVSAFLEQYEQTLRRRIVDTPSDIVRLASQVYSNHRDAIDRIIETKQRMNVTGWAIDPAIDRHSPEDLSEDHHASRYRRFYSKALDEIQELRQGERWTESKRMALFEFLYREETHLTLTLMVGPGNQETRERLWTLGKRKSFEDSWNLEAQFETQATFPDIYEDDTERSGLQPLRSRGGLPEDRQVRFPSSSRTTTGLS